MIVRISVLLCIARARLISHCVAVGRCHYRKVGKDINVGKYDQ
jgi:hypothetical protein